jgi:hypothetical protein
MLKIELFYVSRIPERKMDRVHTISHGVLLEQYRGVSFPIDVQRKAGCTWIVNGEQCKKKWVNDYTYYCEEHKDIPDSKRIIHEPLTTCRKRK